MNVIHVRTGLMLGEIQQIGGIDLKVDHSPLTLCSR